MYLISVTFLPDPDLENPKIPDPTGFATLLFTDTEFLFLFFIYVIPKIMIKTNSWCEKGNEWKKNRNSVSNVSNLWKNVKFIWLNFFLGRFCSECIVTNLISSTLQLQFNFAKNIPIMIYFFLMHKKLVFVYLQLET